MHAEEEKPSRRSSRWRVILFGILCVAVGLIGGTLLGRYGLGRPFPSVRPEAKTEPTAGKPKVLYYRSSMVPGYTSDKPGKDPMGMDLIPVYATEGEEAANIVRIDPATIQNMGIRTATLKEGPLVRVIRTVGRVAYNEEALTFVTTKFEGWIQKLYVNQTGQQVRRGQPLFDVYSPQLYSAQQEYLSALQGLQALGGGSDQARQQQQQLLTAARTKLQFLDVSDTQIEELTRSRTVRKTLTINSPADGVVTEKAVIDGSYIKPDMKLYTIADLAKVWVYVDVYEYQLPWVRLGQKATMRLPYLPGKEYTGRIIYIYPYLNEQTRVVRVRLEFENPRLELKPDMFATVQIQANLGREAVLIPRDAYIDTGTRKVAFRYLGQGRFQPQDIQTGVEGEDDQVEVLSGLAAGDVVVTSGQFLIDAESNLKEAMAKMKEPLPLPHVGKPTPTTGQGGHAGHRMQMPTSRPMTMPEGEKMEMGPMTPPTTSPAAVPEMIQPELSTLLTHYLDMQRLLASDTTKGIAPNAAAMVKAGKAIQEHLPHLGLADSHQVETFLEKIQSAAGKIKGVRLADDRVHFVDLSQAMIQLVDDLRPDPNRWPKLYVYRCPMSKGDWLQASREVANPYYGFQMLKCGDLVATK